jgi:REP element-mobilizing transposase RayT
MELFAGVNRMEYRMPRLARFFSPNTIYHVINRGVDRRPIFRHDEDRQYFLRLMLGALREASCTVLAYCLMGNHFHFLIAAAERALGIPMHRALTEYSMRFNSSNGRNGHLFQGRFFSRPVFDPTYLHNVVDYIHRNPVDAGMVPTVGSWPWSSHADWVSQSDGTIDLSRLEELIGVTPADARSQYLKRSAFMSSPGPKNLSAYDLVRDTASMLGIDPALLESGARGDVFTEARIIILRRAAVEGHSDADLARALNCARAAISMLRKRAGLKDEVNERDCPLR